MRRFVFITILAAFFLSGCSGNDKELVIYLSLLPSEEKSYRELVDRFEYVTGIKTRLISQQYNQIRQAVASEVKAGKGVVDIFEVDVYYLRDSVRFSYDITYLEDYFSQGNLYQEAFKAGKIDNKLFFVPHRISCQALIYNSEYIESPPATWDDYIKLANEFPQKIGLKASLYEGLVCDIFPIVWGMGGDILDLESEGTKEALRLISSLRGLIHPGSRAFKENTILEAQAREEIYLHFNWPFSVNYLKDKGLFPSPNKAVPMPKGKVPASVLGGGYLAISKAAPHKKDAVEFLKFIEVKSSQGFLLKNLGWIPARSDAWLSLDESAKSDFSGFMRSLQFARPRPSVGNYEKVSQLWQGIFHSLVFEGSPVDEVIGKYNKELESILHAGEQAI